MGSEHVHLKPCFIEKSRGIPSHLLQKMCYMNSLILKFLKCVVCQPYLLIRNARTLTFSNNILQFWYVFKGQNACSLVFRKVKNVTNCTLQHSVCFEQCPHTEFDPHAVNYMYVMYVSITTTVWDRGYGTLCFVELLKLSVV